MRKIADAANDNPEDEDEDEDGGEGEVEGGVTKSGSRRVSWLKRGKVAPYEEYDEEEEEVRTTVDARVSPPPPLKGV